MLEVLKRISIRGRVALAAIALQNALIKEGLMDKEEMRLLMDKIWEFTSSNTLDEWEQLISEITPACVLDPKETFEEFTYFDLHVILSIKKNYEEMPKYLVDLIDCAISVGTDNIYGGAGDFSPSTLGPLLELLELCKENHVEIPPVQAFKIFPFSEAEGWGRIFHKNDVVLSS